MLHLEVKGHKVCLVAILEPMVDSCQIERVKLGLGFSYAVDNVTSKIWLFWNEYIKGVVILNKKQFVSLCCMHREVHEQFIFTDVYAKCSNIERRVLWNNLIAIFHSVEPWLIRGDFNIIRKTDASLGGRSMDFAAAGEFNDCIANCGLLELGFIGS